MRKLGSLLGVTFLSGCMPPCPEEACVEQRQMMALMKLGAMAQQQQQAQHQEQLQNAMQDTIRRSLNSATVEVDQNGHGSIYVPQYISPY